MTWTALPDEVRAALRDEKVPAWRSPTLATLTDKRFSDPESIFGRNLDGVRGPGSATAIRCWLLSRDRLPLNNTYPDINVRIARNGALAALAADLPAAVLADLLGIHINTAVRWVKYVGRDWADYIAARAIEQG